MHLPKKFLFSKSMVTPQSTPDSLGGAEESKLPRSPFTIKSKIEPNQQTGGVQLFYIIS